MPHWATLETFNELDRAGLMMFGQMTAGSWIYIGSQGIVQGTYETFVEVGRQHYDGDLSGRWILTGGLGGMGGAQPMAATLAGASLLSVECQPSRIEMRLETGYLDRQSADLDEALAMIDDACGRKEPVSVGLLGNAAEIYPELVRRGVRPDVVTDQTSAHDPLNGYLPAGWSLAEWEERRARDPDGTMQAAKQSMAVQVRAMLDFWDRGVPTLDYGNNIRQMAQEVGVHNAFDFPGFVPAYIRPLFCRGVGPFRWAALSGDPEDIYRTDEKVKELMPDNPHLHNWLDMARRRIRFQGLPARICWVGLGDRHRLGLAFNEMVAKGRVEGAGGDRQGPPGQRIGRQPQPRNRRHDRRLRRRLRLAHAQRDAQHGVGCDVGQPAPWRRCRHRLLPACRHGARVRRHRRSGRAYRPGAVERPGKRRHAPCRRRLRGGRRLRARAQVEPALP